MAKPKVEAEFRSALIKELEAEFPGCMIMHLDPNEIQGIPDLLVLHKNHWATLETKRQTNSSKRPNQEYYVNKMNGMSYSNFVQPENKETVLHELRQLFTSEG